MVEITPKLYVELTMEMVPKAIAKLIEGVKESKKKLEAATDPQQAVQILFGIIKEMREAVGEEVLPQGITNKDMETYKAQHNIEIKEYLESNPDLKEKLNKLEFEFKANIKQLGL